ncbi:ATP-binding cassette, subfamily B, bacterial [Nematocida displodere]|uniref:ATP-binding cassette, subfamily B, bacterial n=1 Tax=Nematocida displodere TaxID=1805483 RepID=A0A177ELF4_9MICR|nr:ATP-binding cassette, subfamily B, bacterial [Nematocida displodere]
MTSEKTVSELVIEEKLLVKYDHIPVKEVKTAPFKPEDSSESEESSEASMATNTPGVAYAPESTSTYPKGLSKYYYLTRDLFLVAFKAKTKKPAIYLILGIVLTIITNNLRIRTLNTSSKLLENLGKRKPGALGLIATNFLESTLFSVVREGYCLAYTLFINYVVAELSNKLFSDTIYSNTDVSSIRINRVMERGNSSTRLLLRKILYVLVNRFIGAVMVTVSIAKIDLVYITLILVFNVIYVLFTYFYTRKRIEFKRRINIEDNNYNNKIVESIKNIGVIKSCNTEDKETSIFANHIRNMLRFFYKDNQIVSIVNIGQMLIYSVMLICVMIHLYLHGETVAMVSFVISLVRELDKIVRDIALGIKDVCTCYVDCEEYLDMKKKMERSSTTRTNPNAIAPILTAPAISEPAITFSNVFFRYKGAPKDLLTDVSFRINVGEKICLLGNSGSGKSTLIFLLLKKYCCAGTISLYNKNIADLDKETITNEVSIVTQDSGMFSTTIKNNLIYGCTEYSESDLEEIVKALGIDQIVQAKGEGLDFFVSENAKNLSGGEQQRISIARSLLRKPKILILDESTSKIDAPLEQSIITYLISLPITLIVITHSPIVAKMMERVVAVDNSLKNQQ